MIIKLTPGQVGVSGILFGVWQNVKLTKQPDATSRHVSLGLGQLPSD
jgi:hypothetical protein